MEQVQKITSKAILTKNNKVFMVLDQAKNWELPGGKMNFGEKPEETLAREIKEELGIDEIHIGKIHSVHEFTKQQKNCECQYLLLAFKCQADLSTISLSDEHSKFAWVGLSNMSEFKMRDCYKQLLNSLFCPNK